MPIDYSRYPTDWKQIRAVILQRADNHCERCGVANYAVGWRDDKGTFEELTPDDNHWVEEGVIRIVLTIAHLDHDIDNNQPTNLQALCQRCHLTHDAKHHVQHAAVTRRRKKIAAGQMEMEML